MSFITQHGLEDEIDIIAYSADFPYAVNFSADLKANKLPKLKYHGKEASLTGLTYFARHVESGSPYYLAGNANRYFRRNLAVGQAAAAPPDGCGNQPAARGGKGIPKQGFSGSACQL